MALEFTNIPDREGPAVYLLGAAPQLDQLTQLGQQIDAATPDETQVVLLDIDSGDGAQVAEFYGFMREQLPAIAIVQDDDTLYQTWLGIDLPAADVIAHYLNQITGASS
ncbi:hypothetical protein KC957_04315 [Candidatus Saccharibacteria bacterium]|nr:hypothetical protein [Candidatus Saccharibacteria bacterium]